MAVYQALLLNTVVPQIQAAQAGDSYVMVVNSTTDALRITQTGAGNALVVEDSANPDATPFVVTAAGDVGIGASSPAYKLEVNGGSSDAMSLFNSTNANGAHLRFAASGTVKSFIGGAPGFLGSGTADDLGIRAVGSVLFATNGSSVDMTLDASGNLGLGVTPSAWGRVGFEIGIVGAAITRDTRDLVLLSNAYWASGGLTYAAGAGAGRFDVGTSGFKWYTAPSGTAGNAITFTQAMTLTAASNLKLGGTAERATTAGTNHLDIFNGTAPVGTLSNGISLYSSSGEAYVMDAAGNATLFSPHDAETNEWIFKSKHTPSGKVLKIDVEKMLRFINDHFGLDAIHEFTEE